MRNIEREGDRMWEIDCGVNGYRDASVSRKIEKIIKLKIINKIKGKSKNKLIKLFG